MKDSKVIVAINKDQAPNAALLTTGWKPTCSSPSRKWLQLSEGVAVPLLLAFLYQFVTKHLLETLPEGLRGSTSRAPVVRAS